LKGISDIHGPWMIVCDTKGRASSLSTNALEACGFAHSALPGMKAADIMRKCLGDAIQEQDLKDILSKGEFYEKLIELQGPGGTRRVVNLNVVPIAEDDDKPKKLICSIREVTEQARIEEILERYAEGLTVLYEISAAFLSEGEMLDIMKRVLDMVRSLYDADVVQVLVPAGNGNSGMFELLAASGSNASSGLRVALSEDSIEGGCIKGRCPIVATDLTSGGQIRRAELTADGSVGSGIGVPMIVDKNIHGVLSILYGKPGHLDTAELWYLNVLSNILSVFIEKQRSFARLSESEIFLNSVLEGIGEGVVVLDPELNIVTANKGYLDIVGLDIVDVIGKPYYKVSLGEDEPLAEDETQSNVMRVFETGRPLSSLNTYLDGKGRKLSIQTKSYPVFGSGGEVVAVVETLMDITRGVRLEKDLEKRVKELEEFYDMAVGRELRMIELKEEIESLREELSRNTGQ